MSHHYSMRNNNNNLKFQINDCPKYLDLFESPSLIEEHSEINI